jgi:3'-5' exoribonuclease
MEQELHNYIGSIEDPWLRKLLEQVLIEDSIFYRQFIEAPAAKLYHHACLGGLLEHSLGTAALAGIVAARYPLVPRDLLLTLALLHDLGKVEAYSWKTSLTQSVEGRLLDHLYLGTRRVERAIDKIPGFPEELRWRVLHGMLAHHGEHDAGSPVRPKTLEAYIVHLLDMLDARIRGFQDHLERQADPAAAWTDRSGMFGEKLFRGQMDLPHPVEETGEDTGEWPDADEEELPF